MVVLSFTEHKLSPTVMKPPRTSLGLGIGREKRNFMVSTNYSELGAVLE